VLFVATGGDVVCTGHSIPLHTVMIFERELLLCRKVGLRWETAARLVQWMFLCSILLMFRVEP
jgi:hypothetical protein